ncbi:MAG: hypothetical protein ACK587_02385 [Cyanobacteriota bacterium]
MAPGAPEERETLLDTWPQAASASGSAPQLKTGARDASRPPTD